jgi:hypothetical protein
MGDEGGGMYVTIRSYDGGDEFADRLVEREQDIRNVSTIDGVESVGTSVASLFDDDEAPTPEPEPAATAGQ